MKILIVGSGGREHALAWKIAQSPQVSKIVCAPGNPGMAALGEIKPVAATDVPGLVDLAKAMDADLVVVGPDAAVEAGLADAMAREGRPCFAPTAAAGRIESSKIFMKHFAARHGVPTAAFETFDSAGPAAAALGRFAPPYVIKADGLAAGKGVIIAKTPDEAEVAIDEILRGRFGPAGARVVIEEFMDGEEVSLFALSDGAHAIPFGSAQDHKRAYDGDQGPNTGGMGAYAPSPAFTSALSTVAMDRIIQPTIAGLAAEGAPYRGVIYAGLMLTQGGPRLVEFNARFGDPECQVLMMRLESDVVPYLMACAQGGLASLPEPRWRDEVVICVVMAAEGYPERPLTGSAISLPTGGFGPGVEVFHAGTALKEGQLVAAGGRVLNICARAPSLAAARALAYGAIAKIGWPQSFHRRDIGWRGLESGAVGE
jgi:phosphoribosylamine--glycine ligase